MPTSLEITIWPRSTLNTQLCPKRRKETRIFTRQHGKDFVQVLEGVPLDVGVDVGQAAAEVGAQHRVQRLQAEAINLTSVQDF